MINPKEVWEKGVSSFFLCVKDILSVCGIWRGCLFETGFLVAQVGLELKM